MPCMDGGSAAISARISAREWTFFDDLFFIAYIIIYSYRKCKRKFGGVCIKVSLHPNCMKSADATSSRAQFLVEFTW